VCVVVADNVVVVVVVGGGIIQRPHIIGADHRQLPLWRWSYRTGPHIQSLHHMPADALWIWC
jgi:hypothetical protein